MFTSCLTIEEIYEFNKNGSGFMEYKVDLSEMASLLEMAAEEEGTPMEEELSFKEVAKKLSGINGISAVNVIDDRENYLFGINFKFKNLQALNQALNKIMLDEEPGQAPHTFFKMENNVISRTHMMNKAMDTKELLGEDESSEMAMAMLENMKYKLNFKFKKPVKVVYSAAEASIAGKKNREVKIEANFKQLAEDTEALNASIVFK
ncbi:MAG: hypothetical protein D6730_13415 [Bacteroidetes bacterium]|nr:MAG: hypothetical protein D6730_13415 [Bacteroidota bacterium]